MEDFFTCPGCDEIKNSTPSHFGRGRSFVTNCGECRKMYCIDCMTKIQSHSYVEYYLCPKCKPPNTKCKTCQSDDYSRKIQRDCCGKDMCSTCADTSCDCVICPNCLKYTCVNRMCVIASENSLV